MDTDFLCEKRLAKLNPHYHTLVKNTAFVLINALEKYKRYFPDFTDHTVLHSLQVIDFCNQLIGENCDKLNEDELFVLIMSAYLHDCGMGIRENDYKNLYETVVSEEYRKSHIHDNVYETIRSFHQKFSNKLIYKYADLFEIPSPEHIKAIATISEGHRKIDLYDENILPTQLTVPSGNTINLPYLTSLIRLADELDIAADRNLEINENGQDTIFKMMHRSIKHLHILPDKFVLDVEADDPALFDGIQKEILKLRETLDTCADVISKRTPFEITQKTVEINRVFSDKKHITVLDTDVGTDDAVAILLSKYLSVNLDYIVTSFGNTAYDGVCKNAVVLKNYLGLNSQVVKGVPPENTDNLPLEEKNTFHGIDGLAGCTEEMIKKLKLTEKDFEEVISLNEFSEKLYEADSVTYIVIGALSNLSQLIDDENLRKKLSGVYVMGGGLNEFNCEHQTEFNFSKYPDGVKKLLNSGLNVTLFPLDVTNHQYLTCEDIDELEKTGVYPEYIKFLRCNIKSNIEYNQINGAVLHDTLPILYLSDPDNFTLEDMRITSDEYGRTMVFPTGEAVHICTGINDGIFRNEIFKAFSIRDNY